MKIRRGGGGRGNLKSDVYLYTSVGKCFKSFAREARDKSDHTDQ